jgi:peptidoglycan hydrolase-like protein with peptidoglycan-binding domain
VPRIGRERLTRIGVPVVLAAGAALVIGIATTAGSSRGASTPAKSGGGVTTVQRRDLVATDTESGTLSYADPQTIFNRLSGTVTWLPSIGQVIKPGGTLYKVSGQPVILMHGSVPAYRDLSEGVTDGPDVKELKQNLIALGFDSTHQITVNNTFDSATTAAVDAWQSSLGETQTGTVSLGSVVFLPGAQRITQVNTTLGSTGGSNSASGSGSSTGASLHLSAAPQAVFVDLTTSATTTSTSTTTTTTSSSSTTTGANCPTATSIASAAAVAAQRAASDCPLPNNPGQNSNSQALQLRALIALLKAETAELRQKAGGTGSTPSTGSRSASGGTGASTSGGFSGAGGGGGGGGGGSSAASVGGGGGGGASSGSTGSTGSTGSGGGAAQAILQSTSTQVVVTVDLDATKQTEAVVGEPVTVELPDGTTVDGKITEVSPVAQTSSSSSSSSGGGGGGGGGGSGSGSPSATIPVTITLTGHRRIHGLDQAAVSVNFEQQKATNVLSVPVTALIATAGGGYAVQEAAAPHQLLPVSPGLFAAGFVQISGSQITPGLQVTDSQG